MKYKIKDSCVQCDLCKTLCMENAIKEGINKNIIFQEMCINCGDCFNQCDFVIEDKA